MQGSLLGSAWLLWRAILAPAAQPGPALMALVATIAQMGLLGALIVFAPRPLYLVHLASTAPWGLEPARRPAARRAADVGAGDAALSGRRALARVVEPAAVRAGAVTTFLKFVHIAAIAIWSGGLIVLPFLFWQRRALPARAGPRPPAPAVAVRLRGDDLARRLHRDRQRNGADLPAEHLPRSGSR